MLTQSVNRKKVIKNIPHTLVFISNTWESSELLFTANSELRFLTNIIQPEFQYQASQQPVNVTTDGKVFWRLKPEDSSTVKES